MACLQERAVWRLPPVCVVDPDAPVNPTDQAIIESLRASPAFVLQPTNKYQ